MPLNYSFSNVRDRLHRLVKPNAPATGRIDKIDADGFICGWAFEIRGVRSMISVAYKGRAIGIFSANLYRRDLELAGVGDAHHAFRIPIPDDPDHFDIEALVISFVHGKSLERGVLLRQWAAVDLLSSPVTPHVHLELTSRCNLRCIYCAVSQPGYKGSDFPLASLEYLIEQVKVRGTTSIAVNGHGETTFIPEWFRATNLFADAGFSLALTSNFAGGSKQMSCQQWRICRSLRSAWTHMIEHCSRSCVAKLISKPFSTIWKKSERRREPAICPNRNSVGAAS